MNPLTLWETHAVRDGLEPLPIDATAPEITAKLRETGSVIVIAAPGAGKTTRLPLHLLDSGLLDSGQLVLLQPRRVAARAAARRLAQQLGESPGQTAGFVTRDESRVSASTRILVATEGVLTRRLLENPFLDGVAAVFLDAFHERSLHTDLALAMLQEVRKTVRPDLLLIAGSATLDPGPLSVYLTVKDRPAAVIDVPGRLFPLSIHHETLPDPRTLEMRTASAVLNALDRVSCGDILVFLPGAREIRAVSAQLTAPLSSRPVDLHLLHGDLPAAAQDAAIAPAPTGRRKVILSTNIAETSLTIEGVRVVIDSGLVRIARFDSRTGIDRLDTERVSRASADQRAGRAGRVAPGTVFRLFSKDDERSLRPFNEPEIERVDLSSALLSVLTWASRPPTEFPWFSPPPAARIDKSLDLLRRLGAVATEGFTLTSRGKRMSFLPLHPRMAALIVDGHAAGLTREAAFVAALLEERDVFPSRPGLERRNIDVPKSRSDILLRLDLLTEFERGGACAVPLDGGTARRVLRLRDRFVKDALRALGPSNPKDPSEDDLLGLIATAYPDRLARRTGADSFAVTGGLRARLSPTSSVHGEDLIVAVDIDTGPAGGFIRLASAAPLALLQVLPSLSGLLTQEVARRWDPDGERVVAERQISVPGLVLSSREIPAPQDAETEKILLEAAVANPLGALAPGEHYQELLERVGFLARVLPELELPEIGTSTLTNWLETLVIGKKRFAELRQTDLAGVLLQSLSFSQRRALETDAPETLPVPTGRQVRIDYSGDQPVLAVKLQELFGLKSSPVLAKGRVRVKLHLLSPAGRPVQVTSDLESFWNTTYPLVRKDLRGRYPKHPWPEDPWNAPPQKGTKRSGR
jgi:ATP-dependent helicase HrpB